MEKTVIYVRVSTDVQEYERQISELNDYAKNNKLEIMETFEDKISGTTKETEREGFNALKEYVVRYNIKNVLVWELSRLGRTKFILSNIEEFFLVQKINLTILKPQLLNLFQPNGEPDHSTSLIFSILGAVTNQELITIKNRLTSGKKEKTRSGNYVGGWVQLGYKVDEETKKIVIDNDINPEYGCSPAQVIKTIYDMYLDGKSSTQIANLLVSRNFPLKDHSMVMKVLSNSSYSCGYKDTKYGRMPIDPIIEEWQYKRAAEKRKKNNTTINKSTKHVNILRDVLVCSECGRMFGLKPRTGYRCNAQAQSYIDRHGNVCKSPVMSMEILNGIVWQYCMPLINSHNYQQYIKNQSKDRNEKIAKLEEEIKGYETKLQHIKKDKKKLNVKFNNDTISEDEFIKEAGAYKTSERNINNKINQLKSNIDLYKKEKAQDFNIENLFNFSDNITDPFQMAELIKAVIKEVTFYQLSRCEKIVKITTITENVDYIFCHTMSHEKPFAYIINSDIKDCLIFDEKEKNFKVGKGLIYELNNSDAFKNTELEKMDLKIGQTIPSNDFKNILSIVQSAAFPYRYPMNLTIPIK